MKRLIVCCDGTWNDLTTQYPTNVVKMAQAVKTDNTKLPQILFYGQGIGTAGKTINRLGGGAFGWGINENIQDAYRFLCLNYQPNDEIYLFGFSRGAYTVRSLAGLIRCAGGVLPRNQIRKTPKVYDIYRSRVYSDSRKDLDRKEQEMRALSQNIQPARITLLGCWDTVGSLGVPRQIPLLSRLLNRKYQFHDYQLSGIIDNALHAIAIDEQRAALEVTPMQQQENNRGFQKLHQVWFPGDHGCVGGGSKAEQGLSDGALLWMIEQMEALELELELDINKIELEPDLEPPQYGIRPDHTSSFDNRIRFPFNLIGKKLRDMKPFNFTDKAGLNFHDIAESVKRRWHTPELNYRPKNLLEIAKIFDWAD